MESSRPPLTGYPENLKQIVSVAKLKSLIECVAGVVAEPNAKAACRLLGDTLSTLMPSDQWWIIFFRQGEIPILFDYYDSNGRQDRYVEGPYLLCPFYNAFIRKIPPGCYSARDLGNRDPIKFERYTKYYFEPLGPLDEIGVMQWVDGKTMALMSVDRTINHPRYCARDLTLLDCLSPLIKQVTLSAWNAFQSEFDSRLAERELRFKHHSELLTGFGSGTLTEREAEIAQYLLKGFSAKELSRILGISEGTARVHMRQIYSKLGVTSQTQLCGNFIEHLLQSD